MRILLLTFLSISFIGTVLLPKVAHSATPAVYMQESRVSMYPNPAKDIVYIKGAGAYRVELMNLIGEVVLSEQLTTDGVSVADLHPGIYIVRTYDADGTLIHSSKLTKQ